MLYNSLILPVNDIFHIKREVFIVGEVVITIHKYNHADQILNPYIKQSKLSIQVTLFDV